jgi:antitoxin (DNA-binding transcriptional repressor) of toxin-antitoxin stability system
MTVFEARNYFARTIEAAKEDLIIVTRNGRPVAAIQAIGDDDIEDLPLERSDRFWDMIARARAGKPIAIETLRKQIIARPKRDRVSPSRPRRSAAKSKPTLKEILLTKAARANLRVPSRRKHRRRTPVLPPGRK